MIKLEELTKAERRKLKKLKRIEDREKERTERLKIQRRKKLLICSLIVILLASSIYLFNWQIKRPGKYDDFAKCLTEKGFIMAGTDWCSSCKNQKNLFGKSFKYVNYKNCDLDKSWCVSNGVKRYPTWILPDGTTKTGVQKLYTLSQLSSSCILK